MSGVGCGLSTAIKRRFPPGSRYVRVRIRLLVKPNNTRDKQQLAS